MFVGIRVIASSVFGYGANTFWGRDTRRETERKRERGRENEREREEEEDVLEAVFFQQRNAYQYLEQVSREYVSKVLG